MLPAVDLTKYQHTETVTIAASPEAVYDLVADITRMGEWSPVSQGGDFDAADTTKFTGHNKNGELEWSTQCRIDVAERGKEFTFVNTGFAGDIALVQWSYTFTPADGGCEVSERWEVLPSYPAFIENLLQGTSAGDYLDGVIEPTQTGMAATLANLKAAAEA